MTVKSILSLYAVVFSSVFLMAGCASKPLQVVSSYAVPVSIDVGSDINQYGDGEARAVVMRIYQLTEASPFEHAEFLNLYQTDAMLLADTLVTVRHLEPLIPGSQREMTLDVKSQTRYLGVLVEFADYINAQPIAIAALSTSPDLYPVTIRLSGQVVDVSVAQPNVKKHWWQ